MMNVFVLFVLLFLGAEALLTLVQFLLAKRKTGKVLRGVLIAVKALFAVACAALVLAGPVQLRKVQPFMMACYIAFLADAFADFCYSLWCLLRKRERKFVFEKTISLLCGVLFLTYGILNMQTVTPKAHEYTSVKLKQEHKIVFVADVHVGSAQPFSVTEKTVRAMKKENAEAVILGGDITDDYTTKEEMEATFALFKDFTCPVYYIYGNHDRQGHAEYANGLQYTEAEFEQAMNRNGVIVLKDSYAQIASDVFLLGREDISAGKLRKKPSKLKNPVPDAYLIVADHQPDQVEKNLATGMDLQLSGHTHAGQLFPLKLLYALIGGYVYGDYDIENAKLLVSAGACGWRMPLRTDAHCNYEVITLKPAS